MPDNATLTIKLEDDGKGDLRHNPLLDEAFGLGPAPTQKAPQFPDTVVGPDGQRVSKTAYESAQRQFQAQQAAAQQRAAKDAFFGPPPLPKGAGGAAAGEGAAGSGLVRQLAGMLGGGQIAGALGAAGPVGAAIAGAVMVVNQFTAAMNAAAKGAKDFASAGEKIINNEIPDIRGKIDETADQMGQMVPILGDMLAAQVKAVNAIGAIPERLTQAFIQRAGQLAGFSGPISGAQAMADVRSIQADIREAQELGPAMARMVDAESQLKNELRELILPIKKFVVEVLADRLEIIVGVVKVYANWPELMQTLVDHLARAIAAAVNPLSKESAKDIINELPKKLKEILKEPEPTDLFDSFFRGAGAAQFSV